MMIKIGDFAKLSQVTVRTLRYYEEVGLLKPVQVDRYTGYRYYQMAQLPRLNRILALKDLGFALDQIAHLLTTDLPPAQLRGMLRLKQAELQQQVAEAQERLARIEARLSQIDLEGTMPEYDVMIKRVDAQRVAMVRDVIPTQEQINQTFNRLFDELERAIKANQAGFAGPGIAVWYDSGMQPQDMHVAAAWPTNGSLGADERVHIEELPAVEQMAYVVHHGPFATLSQAYGALFGWIEGNGYQMTGPSREVYLQYARDGDPAQYVTELQVPVARG
jgi:DNA-binding transcriptional MerR regulator